MSQDALAHRRVSISSAAAISTAVVESLDQPDLNTGNDKLFQSPG